MDHSNLVGDSVSGGFVFRVRQGRRDRRIVGYVRDASASEEAHCRRSTFYDNSGNKDGIFGTNDVGMDLETNLDVHVNADVGTNVGANPAFTTSAATTTTISPYYILLSYFVACPAIFVLAFGTLNC